MPKLFGVDIAAALAEAMGPLMLPATLTKLERGARSPSAPTQGLPVTPNESGCKGFVDTYSHREIATGGVLATDKKLFVLGGTLPSGVIPEPDDKLTIEDVTGITETFRIVKVDRDPAAAGYTLQGRK